jgi:hypothetical protein
LVTTAKGAGLPGGGAAGTATGGVPAAADPARAGGTAPATPGASRGDTKAVAGAVAGGNPADAGVRSGAAGVTVAADCDGWAGCIGERAAQPASSATASAKGVDRQDLRIS